MLGLILCVVFIIFMGYNAHKIKEATYRNENKKSGLTPKPRKCFESNEVKAKAISVKTSREMIEKFNQQQAISNNHNNDKRTPLENWLMDKVNRQTLAGLITSEGNHVIDCPVGVSAETFIKFLMKNSNVESADLLENGQIAFTVV